LVGWGVYRGLIGHIDKDSPAHRLDGKDEFRAIWDRSNPPTKTTLPPGL
jgi:hypothetical protein